VIADRVSQLLGRRVVSLERIQSGGYATAYHAVADLGDGLSVFVKAGTEEVTSRFLHDEIRFYRSFQAPFIPVFHGADEGDPPILFLEDLREGRWPPPWDGDALLYLDVRSDNICLTDRGAVLVDWNQACIGNPELDVAAWLPSLRREGGPEPEDILPGGGGLAAVLAGFFGSRAGLPPPPTAPHVREIQRAQLEVALGWASRELDLRFDR
jgi:Phosphotransferase enzyme family